MQMRWHSKWILKIVEDSLGNRGWERGPQLEGVVHMQETWENVFSWLTGRLCLGAEWGVSLEGSAWLLEGEIWSYPPLMSLHSFSASVSPPLHPLPTYTPQQQLGRHTLCMIDLSNKSHHWSSSQVMRPFENNCSARDSPRTSGWLGRGFQKHRKSVPCSSFRCCDV